MSKKKQPGVLLDQDDWLKRERREKQEILEVLNQYADLNPYDRKFGPSLEQAVAALCRGVARLLRAEED
jgi:hypothetical protein